MLLKESLLHELCHVFNYMVLYLWAPYTVHIIISLSLCTTTCDEIWFKVNMSRDQLCVCVCER